MNYSSLFFFVLLLSFTSCSPSSEKIAKDETITSNKQDKKNSSPDSILMLDRTPILDLAQANRLAQLPLSCLEQEYPNKLNQVISSNADLKSPSELHPAFYGCFDWHSAVHGHWSLVALLKHFPALDSADLIRTKLAQRISKENIEKELLYFDTPHNQSFERTYGWAWLLQLALELHTWDDSLARELEQNLQPLTDLIVQKYLTFYPKLYYPLRIGTHNNTAFGMSFAYDYAVALGDTALKNTIEEAALRFFEKDKNGPLAWEPDGFDFLSPCLEEVRIMQKILDLQHFESWIDDFLPQLKDRNFVLEVGIVTDRQDGHLVHLDGLNFSRAWCLSGLAQEYPDYAHLQNIASQHLAHSLPTITDGNYEGGHWLSSFAIYALLNNGN